MNTCRAARNAPDIIRLDNGFRCWSGSWGEKRPRPTWPLDFASRLRRNSLTLNVRDGRCCACIGRMLSDRKSTRLNSSHANIVCRLLLEKKKKNHHLLYHRINYLTKTNDVSSCISSL